MRIAFHSIRREHAGRPRQYRIITALMCTAVLLCSTSVAQAQQEVEQAQQDQVAAVDAATYQRTVSAAVAFLLEKGQNQEDGSYSSQLGPAVTSMCTTALIRHGLPLEHEAIKKSLTYIETFIQEDGGIYAEGSTLRNYETSVAIMLFVEANEDGRYDQQIQKAVGFLKGIQWDDGEGHATDSTFYGGLGYGSHKRPDLSNTSFFMDAMNASGEDVDSEAIQKAMTFLSRCQNLQSPDNGQEFTQNIRPDDEGGMIYTPVGPESKATWESEDGGGAAVAGNAGGEDVGRAGDQDNDVGGLRSYASMTYAGLKSFLYAGVSKDDIRVQAAKDWIARHYDLSSNPGMGQQGLFYYYHVFAKALDANGERILVDSDGTEHNWRAELVEILAEKQLNDGSWTNPADRWFEGDPNLVTSYALLGLSYCNPSRDE
ncbi:MAG: prenyltransferase/squalene oxidase repeat-containing protein [Planctomycetota bacterium]